MARATTRKSKSTTDIAKLGHTLCDIMMTDLEKSKRPVLEATRCALDNAFYTPKVGYLTPGNKKVRSELNVSSVKKMSRAIFMLEILLNNVKISNINTNNPDRRAKVSHENPSQSE